MLIHEVKLLIEEEIFVIFWSKGEKIVNFFQFYFDIL